MISFRKHAHESTRRPVSLLAGRAGAFAAALFCLLLTAHASYAAPKSVRRAAPKAHAGARVAPKKVEEAGKAEEAADDNDDAWSNVPVRVRRIDTPEGPVLVATIGEFPSDLNEAGQAFLTTEFFEHFASDALGLDESDPKAATLKVAMLPQEKENQRECDFTVGKVAGHIVVLVEKRRVFIACTFAEVGQPPQLLARAGKLSLPADTGD
jgi:hypothetical protein